MLRNPTYLGRLPFNGDVFEAAHEPLVDEELFRLAQELLAVRGESMSLRRKSATEYVLSSLLRCARCGSAFIGTGAHGKKGTYRYYACIKRNRQGAAACDQVWIPAEAVEDAILTTTLQTLENTSFFEEVARLTRQEWEKAHPGREKDLRRIERALEEKRAAIDKYLRAFETGKLPEEACSHRVAALQREIVSLETDQGRLEVECDRAPTIPTDDLLAELRRGILRASEEKSIEKLKQLLVCVADEIVVEGRQLITPYFFSPGVLIPFPSRRRKESNPPTTSTAVLRF